MARNGSFSTVLPVDIDNDADVDVLSVLLLGLFQSTLYLFENDGLGNFPLQATIVFQLGQRAAFCVGDLNADGFLDLVTVDLENITIFLNNGAGFLARVVGNTTKIAGTTTAPLILGSADLDGNGNLDIYLCNTRGGLFLPEPASYAWLKNDGTANFVLGLPSTLLPYEYVFTFSALDVNADSHVDFLFSDGARDFGWLRNNGTGFFSSPMVYVSSAPRCEFVVLSDVNNDGFLDIVYSSEEGPFVLIGRPAIAATGLRSSLSSVEACLQPGSLPPECGGVATSAACLASCITAASNLCRPSALPVVSSTLETTCFLAPLGIRTNPYSPLTLTAPAGAPARVDCTSPDKQSWLTLYSNSMLIVENFVLLASINASIAGNTGNVAKRSLISACTAECLFSESSRVVLRNVSVTGFSNLAGVPGSLTGPALDFGFGALVLFAQSTALLVNCSFVANRCGSVGAVASLVGSRSGLVAQNCTFIGNVAFGSADSVLGAGGGGGVFAVLGADSSLVVSDSYFSENAAPSGGGGVILVFASATGATSVSVENCLFVNSSASYGGVLAVQSSSVDLALRRCRLEGSQATFGGSLALISSTIAVSPLFTGLTASLIPPVGLSTGPTRLVLDASTHVADSRATFGGLALLCLQSNVTLAGTVDRIKADVGGGVLFICRNWEAGSSLNLSSAFAAFPGSAAYGPFRASPAASIDVSSVPPVAASGASLGRPLASDAVGGASSAAAFVSSGATVTVLVLDSYNQTILDSKVLVRMETLPEGPAGSAVFPSVTIVDSITVESSLYDVSQFSLTARSWNVLPVAVPVRVTISGGETLPWIAQAYLSITLTSCPFGYGRTSPEDNSTALVCAPCSSGRVSVATEPNVFTTEVCALCPANSYLPESRGIGQTQFECTCNPGFFSLTGNGSACAMCPVGASCAGGSALPSSTDGFWQVGDSTFLRCPLAGACLAGSRCASGYAGFLCKDCQVGYFRDAQGACKRCPPGSAGAFAAFILLLILASLVAFALVLVAVIKSSGEVLRPSQLRARTLPASVFLVIQAMQIVQIIAVAPFSWPAGAQRALNAFSIFSLDLNLFASECTLASFEASYAASLVAPLFFALVLVASCLGYSLLRRVVAAMADMPEISTRGVLMSTLFAVGPLVYLPLARATLVLLDCRKLPGSSAYWLKASLARKCYSATWWGLFPVCLAGLLVYVLGIPCLMLVTLLRNRAELFSKASVYRHYGGLYKLVRRPFYALPVVLMGKKFAIACASLFLSLVPSLLFAVLFALVAGAGLAQSLLKPYYFVIYERLELALTSVLSILLVCGMVLFAEQGNESGKSLPPAGQLAVVIVFACIVALFLIAVYFITMDIGEIRRERARLAADLPLRSFDVRAAAHMSTLLRDVDDPDALLASLARLPAESADRADRLDSVASVGMVELPVL